MLWSYLSLYDDRIDVILLNITLRKKQMDNDEKEKQKQLLFIQEDSVKTVTFPCLVYSYLYPSSRTDWMTTRYGFPGVLCGGRLFLKGAKMLVNIYIFFFFIKPCLQKNLWTCALNSHYLIHWSILRFWPFFASITCRLSDHWKKRSVWKTCL